MSIEPASTGHSVINPAERILVSENDSSTLLGVSKPTFRRWVAVGLIRPVAMPNGMRRKLYRRSDLEAFAAALLADDHVAQG